MTCECPYCGETFYNRANASGHHCEPGHGRALYENALREGFEAARMTTESLVNSYTGLFKTINTYETFEDFLRSRKHDN